jgi:hypothetical protein
VLFLNKVWGGWGEWGGRAKSGSKAFGELLCSQPKAKNGLRFNTRSLFL